jgi:hypothetical protein
MARITGSDGTCSVTGYKILFNTWSATFSQAITDLTAFGDTFAAKKGGVMSGTFSASGIMQKDVDGEPMPTPGGNIAMASSGVNVDLKAATGSDCMWSGSAVIGNVSPTSTMGGDASCSVDGEFDGAITLTWDES